MKGFSTVPNISAEVLFELALQRAELGLRRIG